MEQITCSGISTYFYASICVTPLKYLETCVNIEHIIVNVKSITPIIKPKTNESDHILECTFCVSVLLCVHHQIQTTTVIMVMTKPLQNHYKMLKYRSSVNGQSFFYMSDMFCCNVLYCVELDWWHLKVQPCSLQVLNIQIISSKYIYYIRPKLWVISTSTQVCLKCLILDSIHMKES